MDRKLILVYLSFTSTHLQQLLLDYITQFSQLDGTSCRRQDYGISIKAIKEGEREGEFI